MLKITTIAAIIISIAASGLAQSHVDDVYPQNPTTSTPIILYTDSCRTIFGIEITGFEITVRSGPPVNNCLAAPVTLPLSIGYLRTPGTYTARIVDVTPSGEIVGPPFRFAVAADMPALKPLALFALVGTLLVVALRVLHSS